MLNRFVNAARSGALERAMLPIVLFGAIGAACWQPVRFSGEACGWTMGVIWGLAWLFVGAAHGEGGGRGRYARPWAVLAMVAGFYFGGQHGYGQFHDWVTGVFHLDRSGGRGVEIHPAAGYGWIFLCGVGWGGLAGLTLSWVDGTRQAAWGSWALRLALVVGGAWAFQKIAASWPALVMPLYGRVDYTDLTGCPDCARTTVTLVESMKWIGAWAGGMLAEALLRNGRGVAFIAVMGAGFGVAFTAFEWLHLLEDGTPPRWWHFWETSVGLLGGVTLGVCFLLFNRPDGDRAARPGPGPAEYLIGLWLPLLLSLYYVLPFRAARGARFAGDISREQEAALLETLTQGITPALVLVGLYLTHRALHRPEDGSPHSDPRQIGRLFLAIYVGYFLLSYLPRFGLVVRDDGFGWTQATYGVAFALSLAAYRRLRRPFRARGC